MSRGRPKGNNFERAIYAPSCIVVAFIFLELCRRGETKKKAQSDKGQKNYFFVFQMKALAGIKMSFELQRLVQKVCVSSV